MPEAVTTISSNTTQTTQPAGSIGEIRLNGRWLRIARIACLAIALVASGIWAWGVPLRYMQLGTVCAGPPCGDQQATSASIPAFRAAGITLSFYATYIGTVEVLYTLVFLVLAALIFWRKSETRIGLITTLFLVTFAVTQSSANALVSAFPTFTIPVNLLSGLSYIFLLLFLFLFPDGQFVPRWSRLVMLMWIPFFLLSQVILPSNVFVALLFASIIVSLTAQLYRYRRVSTSLQRRQTRWAVFGALLGMLGSISIIAAVNILPLVQIPDGWGFIIGDTFVYLFSALVPLSIGIAIIRSRLWDIDIIINRTLVYSTLTAILAAVYFGLVVVLNYLLRGIINQNSDIAIVASTLVIAVLFRPLRNRLQLLIDRRFYRRKYDAARILAEFSTTLRGEVELRQLREHLLTVVQETMQPAHVSLWLRTPENEGKRRFSLQEKRLAERIGSARPSR